MYTSIYSGGYPSALDFDYRYKQRYALNYIIKAIFIVLQCTGEGTCFGRTQTVIEFTELGSMAPEQPF